MINRLSCSLCFCLYSLLAAWCPQIFCDCCDRSPTGDRWLLTPGPLTTSAEVKSAMLHDIGSRDWDFIELNRNILERLLSIVNGHKTHVAVPLQGSGTFIAEAMLRTLIPSDGKVLVLANGVYGHRIAAICAEMGRPYQILAFPDDQMMDIDTIGKILSSDCEKEITHVACVYCETSTGMLNPIQRIAEVVKKHGRKLLIDAMSAFGALPLDCEDVPFDAVAASSNKCLQGVPGMGFCIVRRDALERCQGNAESLCLDLYAQWKGMEKNGQWRFTPPTHTMMALEKALDDFDREGGAPGRYARYKNNFSVLCDEMQRMGFKLYLEEGLRAPIIATFLMPQHPSFRFPLFYSSLREKGFVIYPGKLQEVDTFRIGAIGELYEEQIRGAVKAIQETLQELGE